MRELSNRSPLNLVPFQKGVKALVTLGVPCFVLCFDSGSAMVASGGRHVELSTILQWRWFGQDGAKCCVRVGANVGGSRASQPAAS